MNNINLFFQAMLGVTSIVDLVKNSLFRQAFGISTFMKPSTNNLVKTILNVELDVSFLPLDVISS